MRATNSITNSQPKRGFTATISGDAVQKMILSSLKDPRRAASFTSTLISVVNGSYQLQQCEPASIISAALRGEGMNLSLALGQYSVVPYGTKANYQLSYKGLAQLATRSGQYKDFGVFDVREGEYKGSNPRTRQPVIEWLDDDERENLPLAGFYGFYELQNGFFKSIYWTHEKILNHADRYSKAFSKEKYMNLLAGKLPKQEADKLRNGSPWYDEPLSEAHQKMCKKTVLIQMLGDGTAPLSLEMSTAIKEETMKESGGEFFYADDPRIVEANAPAPNEPVPIMPEEAEEVEAKVIEPMPVPAMKEEKKPASSSRKGKASAQAVDSSPAPKAVLPDDAPIINDIDDDFMPIPEVDPLTGEIIGDASANSQMSFFERL